MTKILPYQLNLSPTLPVVLGNKDYLDSEQLLHRINEMLCIGNIDSLFIRLCFEKWQSELSESKKKELSATTIADFNEESSKAIRTVILKSLLGFSVSVHEVKKHQCGGMQVFLAEWLVAGFKFRVLGVGAKPGVWA